MERGLLWLPLLVFFIGFAWLGWREYQKVEAYQKWATAFDQAKYDIYAVLGQKGQVLTWGKPHQGEPIDLQTFSLDDVYKIELSIDDQIVETDTLPQKGNPNLVFYLVDDQPIVKIPFTEISLAVQWLKYLRKMIN